MNGSSQGLEFGAALGLSGASRLVNARTRSISPENRTGDVGNGGRALEGTGANFARDLGQGWKVSPSLDLAPKQTLVLADIVGSGVLQHLWITHLTDVRSRDLILRIYWDNQEHPSVEVPLGDFFCCGWEEFAQVSSLPVVVNPGRGFNCYWEMPFRSRALITLENRSPIATSIYYQLNYAEMSIPSDCAYFHAQFRRSNPVTRGKDHVILDGVQGRGHYVGTYIAWGVNEGGWWGEGELKFFLDQDDLFPSLCGTGTEDYFGGSHNFDVGTAERGKPNAYTAFTTAYLGMPQVLQSDGCYQSQQRFGLYRWHLPDPVRFESQLRVTVQCLGWHHDPEPHRRYRLRQDDVASVAYWYQTLPSVAFPSLAAREALEVR